VMEVTPHANRCSFRTIEWAAGECLSMLGGLPVRSPFVRPDIWLVNSIKFLYMQGSIEFRATMAFGGPIAKQVSLAPRTGPTGGEADWSS
jgi:hypothetical protein